MNYSRSERKELQQEFVYVLAQLTVSSRKTEQQQQIIQAAVLQVRHA